MAIVKVIRARENDTLCGMAVDNGFRDCRKVRDVNPDFQTREMQPGDSVNIPEVTPKVDSGQTEVLHRFRRPGRPIASIRFVHGTSTLPVEQDPTLRVLNVSNYVTDLAGNPDGSVPWVNETVTAFEPNSDKDVDTFKVEVKDIRATQNDLKVNLEALRPRYDPGDPRGRRVIRHEEFPGAERARRSLNDVTASRQGTGKRFRSGYLRLVTDNEDKQGAAALPVPAGTFLPQPGHAGRVKQALLVTDMHDEGDTQVEILDQQARAAYQIERCPGPANVRCRVKTQSPIGTDRKRMRIALHVVRQTPGGAPIVPLVDAERRLRTWFRRVYAQGAIGPRIILAREVDPVENLISVSEPPAGAAANAGGRNASGVTGAGAPSSLGFRINAVGQPSQVIGPITPAAGATPIQTANRLAGLVRAPFTATASQNPRRINPSDVGRSADILIKGPAGAQVTIDQIVMTDTAQDLTVGDVNPLPAQLQDWLDRFQGGSIHHRVLMKNYNTTDGNKQVVDVFVVSAFTNGDRGEALMKGNRFGDPTLRALPETEFSVFVVQSTMGAGDADPFVLQHEIGHVVGEVVHAPAVTAGATVVSGERFQLMCSAVSGNHEVGSSKRLRDGVVTYDSPAAPVNLISRIRAEGAPVLENW